MNSPSRPGESAPKVSGAAAERPAKADDALPAVDPPSSAFILQLFLIPLLIVGIIVSVWLMFSWLAHMGNDPQKLVQDIRKMNSASWQKALVLANMLRNEQYDHLKDDPQLAMELAGLLERQLEEGGNDDRAIKLRRFLSRALGEFRRPEVLPVLVEAADQERYPRDVEVRRSALAGIAVLSSNIGAEAIRNDPRAMEVLLAASRERGDQGPDRSERAAIRSTAAFTLGVIGGPEATDRLAQLTADAEPDVRYNAAIGLARNGDTRAVETLREMLDPDNELAVRDETSDSARRLKRMDVLANAIRASLKLHEQNPQWDPAPVAPQLRELAAADQYRPVAMEARAALAKFGLRDE